MHGSRARAALWPVVLLLAAAAPGRTAEIQTTFNRLEVPRLSLLSISGDVSGLLTLTQDGAGESDFDSGRIESASDQTILTITTNDEWDLSARLAGAWTCPGSYDKDEDDLFIRITNTPTGTILNGADSYINLALTDMQVLSHTGAVTDNAVNIQTRVLLDWTQDIPGAYSITVTYTLAVHLP
jgi:hypothetical protein